MPDVWTIVGTAAAAALLTFILIKLVDHLRRRDAETEARDILSRAERESAARRKEAELEIKELAIQQKAQGEQDLAKLRQEVHERERLLDKRQDMLEQQSEQLRRQEKMVESTQRKLAERIEDTNRRNKVVRLLWRFQLAIELKPLIGSESRALVERNLTREPIEFESDRVQEAFIVQVVRESRGIPAAIEGMLRTAINEREVTRRTLRAYRHEAAITYIDMTPMILVLVVCLMALRYVSRGAGIQELMVMAGVGTALFSLILFFARRMSAPGR
jgi:hypothetical protein